VTGHPNQTIIKILRFCAACHALDDGFFVSLKENK
jgi:hypothetical protein